MLQVKDAIFKTLIRNGMFDDAHIRLTLTRGKKVGRCYSYFGSLLVEEANFEIFM